MKKAVNKQITGHFNDDDDFDSLSVSSEESVKVRDKNGNISADSFDEEFMCRIFYKDEEITEIKGKQQQDIFKEIRLLKDAAINETKQLLCTNKFNIQDYAPKPKTVRGSRN